MRAAKAAFCIFFALGILCLVLVPVCAESETDIPEREWQNFSDSLPPEVTERLPNEALEGEQGFFESVSKLSGGKYIAEVILDIAGVELGGALRLFVTLCALLLLAALFNTFGEGVGNSALGTAVRFCSVGGIASVIIYTQYEHFILIEELFEKLGVMMNGMIPIVASIWALGGNVGTASAGSASFGVMLGVSLGVFAKTLIPICCLLTVFGICDALTDEMRVGRIMSAFKRIYIFLLGLVMTVLLWSLGAQTTIAASADSAAARAAKLVSGSVIPVLGGSVGETFRSVATGVAYMKNVFGIGGIIMLALLVLPAMVSVLLTRFVFLVCSGLAEMLGCSSEARLFESLGEVYGFILAVVSGISVMFVLGLYIFMQTVVAVV